MYIYISLSLSYSFSPTHSLSLSLQNACSIAFEQKAYKETLHYSIQAEKLLPILLYRRLHNADDEDDDEREVEAREMRKKVKASRVGEDTYKGEEMAGLGSGFLPPISPKGSGFSPHEDLVRALKIGKDSQLGDMHYKYIHYHPSIARKTALNTFASAVGK